MGKHEKKHKKPKKHHKRRRRHSSASDTSSASADANTSVNVDQEETAAPVQKLERQSWMTAPPKDLFATQRHVKSTEDTAETSSHGSARQYGVALPPTMRTAPQSTAATADESHSTMEAPKRHVTGDGGSYWRRMKLKRIIEQAEREGRPVEEITIEKYGSMAAYEDAKREFEAHRPSTEVRRRESASSTTSSIFRKPGEGLTRVNSETSSLSRRSENEKREEAKQRFDKEREAKLYQPLPDDYHELDEPQSQAGRDFSVLERGAVPTSEGVSSSDLNRLKAQALKARLLNAPNAAELEAAYEKALKAKEQTPKEHVVLPSYDIRGRYIDVGRPEDAVASSSRGPVKRKAANLDDDKDLDVKQLLHQERTSGKSFDDQFARRIVTDAGFSSNLDYLEDHADRLTQKKERSEAQKRTFAIADYKRSQSILEKCWYCFDEGRSPQVPVIAVGVQMYLALPKTLPLIPGHCFIVPMHHHLSTLDCDDSAWDEIRNFMKCLIRMFDAKNQGVVFIETCTHFKRQRHAFIECIPVPHSAFDELPGIFQQGILEHSEEWSQHKKVIDTRQRGFRRSLVSNLPYFHIWFEPDGGYGHVIENEDSFPGAFGRETIGGVLDLSRDRWRKPRLKTSAENDQDMREFKRMFDPFDWTKQLR